MTISIPDSMSGSCRMSTGALIGGTFGSSGRLQRTHADQVIRRGGEEKLPIDPRAAAMVELAQIPDGLHPAEDFFDALTSALTEIVARVARRASVQGAAVFLEGDVRRGPELTQRLDEAARVIRFITPDGLTSLAKARRPPSGTGLSPCRTSGGTRSDCRRSVTQAAPG